MKKRRNNRLVYMLDEKVNYSHGWWILPFLLLFMELIGYYYLFGFNLNYGWIFSAITAISFGLIINVILSFMPRVAQKIVAVVLLLILGIYYSVVLIYYSIFHSFFIWQTIGLANDVTQFYREAIDGILANWYKVLTSLLPAILVCFLIGHKKIQTGWINKLISFAVTLALSFFLIYNMNYTDNNRIVSHFKDDTSSVYKHYGILTSSLIDIQQTIFPSQESFGGDNQVIDNSIQGKTDFTSSVEKLVEKNIIYIDFEKMIENTSDATIKSMHQYFQSKEATELNEYTAMFEGKNLIFLTLEGFSDKVIDPELTPTLYKMATEGFIFENFYNPLWGGSTASGEYCNMTGNFYSNASCIAKSANTLTYSAMGNLFMNSGYTTFAYHNHTYDYYSRDLAHPNFGYPTYKGIGNGLVLDYYCWPNSDYEMMKSSINDYINTDEPFHVYYMTVSGHMNYTYIGNSMASYHRSEVENLPYSNEVKPYIATQLEVEKALTYLVEKLDEAGKLDDTVFAMCADHYPYGMTDAGLAELYNLDINNIRDNLELYKNSFILYCSSMENPIEVQQYCGPYDIVPTLANLFGIEFDSRFITGSDILSNGEHIAIINTMTSTGGNYNWKTEQGTYYSASKSFVKSDNCTLNDDGIEDYVQKINGKLNLSRKYSLAILDYDYYSYVFNKDGSAKYPLE